MAMKQDWGGIPELSKKNFFWWRGSRGMEIKGNYGK